MVALSKSLQMRLLLLAAPAVVIGCWCAAASRWSNHWHWLVPCFLFYEGLLALLTPRQFAQVLFDIAYPRRFGVILLVLSIVPGLDAALTLYHGR
jgi:hypothetical protein